MPNLLSKNWSVIMAKRQSHEAKLIAEVQRLLPEFQRRMRLDGWRFPSILVTEETESQLRKGLGHAASIGYSIEKREGEFRISKAIPLDLVPYCVAHELAHVMLLQFEPLMQSACNALGSVGEQLHHEYENVHEGLAHDIAHAMGVKMPPVSWWV